MAVARKIKPDLGSYLASAGHRGIYVAWPAGEHEWKHFHFYPSEKVVNVHAPIQLNGHDYFMSVELPCRDKKDAQRICEALHGAYRGRLIPLANRAYAAGGDPRDKVVPVCLPDLQIWQD